VRATLHPKPGLDDKTIKSYLFALKARPLPKGGLAGAIGSALGAVPYILSQLPSAVQDIALLRLIFAFFSCGPSIQGAGSRLMSSYARDDAEKPAAVK
jgi:hypothetical protein